jgi:hypothetical protein
MMVSHRKLRLGVQVSTNVSTQHSCHNLYALTALTRRLSLPVDLQQVFFGIVMRLQPATIGVPEGFSDAVRKVYISRSHQQTAIVFLYIHDSLQRVFRLRLLLNVADEVHHLGTVLRYEISFELDIARGKVIMNTVAGGADYGCRAFRSRQPLPSAFVKESPALRAHARLLQLAAGCIGVI